MSRWTIAKGGFVLILAGSILGADGGKAPTVAEAPPVYAPAPLEEDGFTVRETDRWGTFAPPQSRLTMAE
ncbi:MAG: hypothetical protein O3A96_15710 [Proteobacteria bacterium]|nr:hypothetical protein [Pseudomonadota bacterium]